jgi:hypothetical protein
MWVRSTTARIARGGVGIHLRLTAAEQVQKDSMPTGHPPTGSRCSTPCSPDFGKKFPGNDVFAENLPT